MAKMAAEESGDDLPGYMNFRFDEDEVSSGDELGGLDAGEAALVPAEIPLSDLRVEATKFPDENGWTENDDPPFLTPFNDEDGGTLNRDPGGPDALNFVKLFITDELIDLFVTETNNYANAKIQTQGGGGRLSRWKDTTRDEFKVFIALILLIGVVRKSNVEDYWSTDEATPTPYFRKHMSYNRFFLLYNNFHLLNNDTAITDVRNPNSDALYKLRPLISHLREAFVEVFTPEQDLSIDEATCPFKGCVKFRVFNPAKPDRFGIKLFEVCEAKSVSDIYCGHTEI